MLWYYGIAEFLALKDGLKLCRELNIDPVLIESDSELVVKAIEARKVSNWQLEYPLPKCLMSFSDNFKIAHGFRQKNQVADRLAAVAHRVPRRWNIFECKIYLQRLVALSSRTTLVYGAFESDLYFAFSNVFIDD